MCAVVSCCCVCSGVCVGCGAAAAHFTGVVGVNVGAVADSVIVVVGMVLVVVLEVVCVSVFAMLSRTVATVGTARVAKIAGPCTALAASDASGVRYLTVVGVVEVGLVVVCL